MKKYEDIELMEFIEKQNRDWELHRKRIGSFGRMFENIFGSSFAHQQIEEYKQFCESHGYIYSIIKAL